MQIFLPYADFNESAKCLDYRRLGKQRVETKQVYLALTDPSYGWQNHPAIKMWSQSNNKNWNSHTLNCLAAYGAIICREWIGRGYKDSLLPWFMERLGSDLSWEAGKPHWVGDAAFHASHRSNLLRKDPEYYGRFGWKEPADLPYVWP